MLLLSLEEAKEFLLRTGEFIEPPALPNPLPEGDFPFSEPIVVSPQPIIPNDTRLSFYLNTIEAKLTDYLNGQVIEVKSYLITRQSNSKGIVTLPFYPVVSIDKIEIVGPMNTYQPLPPRQIHGSWTGGINVIGLYPYRQHRVAYQAGYATDSTEFVAFANATKLLLLKAAQTGNIDWLHGMSKETTSASLAGLSQSYQILGAGGDANWLDAIAGRIVRSRKLVW